LQADYCTYQDGAKDVRNRSNIRAPHDICIYKERNGNGQALEADLRYINAIGSLVRLELKIADKAELIEAELTQVRFRELQLTQGEHVFIYPRNVRVFLDDAPTVA
jgi:sulfate transport system ATP-binding protein